MITRPAGSSRYTVLCGSSGRQSAAVEEAITSAEVSGRRPDSGGAARGAEAGAGGAEAGRAAVGAAAVGTAAGSAVAARVTTVSAASSGSARTLLTLEPLNRRP